MVFSSRFVSPTYNYCLPKTTRQLLSTLDKMGGFVVMRICSARLVAIGIVGMILPFIRGKCDRVLQRIRLLVQLPWRVQSSEVVGQVCKVDAIGDFDFPASTDHVTNLVFQQKSLLLLTIPPVKSAIKSFCIDTKKRI